VSEEVADILADLGPGQMLKIPGCRCSRTPLAQVQSEASRIGTKISAFGKLQSEIARFRDAAAELARPATWRAVTARSADAAAVEVSARPGAAPNPYTVEVTQLAQSQSVTSAAMAGTDAVIGGGTLKIQLGTQPSGTAGFAADPERPEVSVVIAPGSTLAEVRDAINVSGAGVRAAILRDGSQVRLLVTGVGSGGDQAFRMLVDDADGGPTDAARRGCSVAAESNEQRASRLLAKRFCTAP